MTGLHSGKLKGCGRCVCLSVANNPASLRLVGLCPLLAVTTSLLKATCMAAMLLMVMLAANGVTSLLRATVVWRLKPIYFALVASFAVVAAFDVATIVAPGLVKSLGIYPLLLAANCLVLSSIQEFAEHQPFGTSLRAALRDASGIGATLILIAAIRELAAFGQLFHDYHLVAELPLASNYQPQGILPIMAQAPGALLVLAIVLAAFNFVKTRYKDPLPQPQNR